MKRLEIAGKAWKGWKWLEIAEGMELDGNGLKWLDLVGNGWNGLNGWNDWKLQEMAGMSGNVWKLLEITGMTGGSIL